MFGRVDFREDEKKKEKNFFFLKSVWLGGGEGKEMVFGSFLPGSYKNFSPQNGEKTEGRKCASAHGRKCLCALAHGLIPRHLLFSFFFFFSIQLLCLPFFFFIHLHIQNFFAKKMLLFYFI